MPVQSRQLDRQAILSIIRKLDHDLAGTQKKVKLYCVGGTYLVLTRIRDSSKDIDFIISRQDFRTLSGHILEIETKDKVRFDLFPEGELPGFAFKNYDFGSQKMPFSFDHIEIYEMDLASFILTKVLAGRAEDYEDIEKLVPDRASLPKEKLIAKFKELQFTKGKKSILEKKLKAFLKEFYGKKSA